jgi:hypothetical protein
VPSILILAGVSTVIVVAFALFVRDQRFTKEMLLPFRLRQLVNVFWLNPRKNCDFTFVWLARVLIFLGTTTVVNYFTFFLQNGIHYTHLFPGQSVAQGVQTFFGLYVICLLVSSLMCLLRRLSFSS